MRDKRKWIIIILGLFFYLFHYTILYPLGALGWGISDSIEFFFSQVIWFTLWLLINILLFHLLKLSVSNVCKSLIYLFALCIIAHCLYLPDKIDFIVIRKNLEKRRLTKKANNPLDIIVVAYYYTDYPKRMPLITDNRYFAFGSPEEITTYYNQNPGRCFVKVHKTGWYVLYKENVYNPSYAINNKNIKPTGYSLFQLFNKVNWNCQ